MSSSAVSVRPIPAQGAEVESVVRELLRMIFLAAPLVGAGILHMACVKLRVLERLKVPIDGGRSWRGARIFGDNKTWRGIVLMIGLTILCYGAQTLLVGRFEALARLTYYDYAAVPVWWAGGLLGLGYALAELPNSFLKRRLGIRSGKAGQGWLGRVFLVVDQADSVLGCLVFMAIYWVPPWTVFVGTLVTGTALHLLFNGLLRLAGLKRDRPESENPPAGGPDEESGET